MLQIALAFLGGDLWLQRLPALTTQSLAIPLVGAMLLAGLAWWWPAARTYIPFIVAFLLGFVWTALQAHWRLQSDLDPALEGDDLTVTGYIAAIPQREDYGVRFAFVLDAPAQLPGLPPRIELTWYRPTLAVQAAQRWQLQVRLKRRHGFANPGGYDYEAQLFRDHIGASGYIRTTPSNRLLGVQPGAWILKARAYLTEAIARALPHTSMQGVVRGLAVGDQQAIDSEAWRVFARTGTSHLMAISGFHIGMVAWLCAWLGSRLAYLPRAQAWRWAMPDLRALFGMSAALSYSLLAGMSVPTQRTLIMLLVYFGAQCLRREVHIWHSFGLALLLVLLWDPMAPLAIGAWLSFGAVAVILLNQTGRLGRQSLWREFLNIQAVVSIGLVPLLLCAFGGLSLISPWVNLLAIPVFTALLVPLVLIGCALLWLNETLAQLWLQCVARGLEWVFAGLQWAAALPWANWYAPQAPPWTLALLVLGTVMMVLPWAWPLRLSGLLWCVPALSWRVPAPPPGGFELTTLDVGQGLAVAVRTARHTLLYDAGPRFQSGRDTGELVVLPYLHALGVRRLSTVIGSHGDDDHVGGLQTVMRNLPVDSLWLGPSVPPLPGALTCRRGQHWQWDQVQFTVLHPGPEHAGASDNDRSCVVAIRAVGGSALLLGDIEQHMERELVQAGLIAQSNLVIAAHHGSRSSSTMALIAATQADWVVFSAGYRNRWGFPKEEVQARWRDSGASTLSTIESGAVTIQLFPDEPARIERYRLSHPHYWQP